MQPGPEPSPEASRADGPEPDRGQLARACELLAEGEVVVVPNPPPMTYSLVATTAGTINAVKGRAPDQNVAISVHNESEWSRLVPVLDLPAAAVAGAVSLLARRLSLLLPVLPDAAIPAWVAPAVRNDQVAVFNGWWAPTALLWQRFPRLYGSSANRTGEAPATSAVQARRAFGRDCFVIDADPLIDADPTGSAPKRRAASTMLRLDRRGRMGLHRSGAQDQSWSPRPEAYLPYIADLVGLSFD